MAHYQIIEQQLINAPIQEIWDFIANPLNLEKITPTELGFEITSAVPIKMYPGLIICYKVTPLLGIKTPWVTEITHVKPGEFFVDEQRIGPYKLWHHQHHLRRVGDQVEMTDIITYSPPMGVIGGLFNRLIIKKKLKQIFNHRRNVIDQLFN